jgi:enoyl-CoA hydratase/carnithine racemase
LRIGLVDQVVPEGDLDAALDRAVDGLLKVSPGGLAVSKASIADNARPRMDAAATERALTAFVDGRASSQAAEGSAAFMEKRPPSWAKEVNA